MFESRWIFEIILFIYSASLIGYFIDFMNSNWRANKISFQLLSFVWVLQTAVLVQSAFSSKSFPIINITDGLFFYAWILLTFSLLMNRLFKIDFIAFFTNVFSFFLLLLAILLNAERSMHEEGIRLVHEILITHISLAIISYGFFTISFLLAMMYLIQYRFLKNKFGRRWMWRFGDLKQLDHLSYTAVMIGVPLLLIALIFGFVWAYAANAEFYWFDIKTIGSVIVLFIYIIYLFLRLMKGYRGKPISIYNCAAFLLLLLNYFLFSLLSNFHF